MKQMKAFALVAIFMALVIHPAHSQELRPGNPIGGLSVKGGKNPGGNLLLSNQVISNLFSPLATQGFVFESAEIISYDAGTYLVTNFVNRENKATETIGVIMYPEGDFLFIKEDKPKKCGWNLYCKCELPLCLGCQRPGGTSIEKCGYASISSAQYDSYSNSLARLAQPGSGPKKIKKIASETKKQMN